MILLDTHALVWMLREPDKISVGGRQCIATSGSLAVSAASLYEIALKGGRGKWPQVVGMLEADLESRFLQDGIAVLPVTGRVMQRAGALDWDHRDPFDRMIVVTALEQGIPVVSKDVTLDTLGDAAFRRVW